MNEKLFITGSYQNAESGWYEVNVEGSHHQYKHPTKKGRTTVKIQIAPTPSWHI